MNNYNQHAKGRIWVGWRHDRCKLESCETHKLFIATKITPVNSGESFQVIFVYGLHNVSDIRDLWIELQQTNQDIPCLFIGDFNAVCKEEHRKNGSQVTTYEMYDMRKWMDDMELHPIIERGHMFSWTDKEKGDDRILTKIDHAIGNLQWMDRYSQASVWYANPQTSDHTPLIVSLTCQYQQECKPFRFLNYLCEHQDFLQVVRAAWKIKTKGTGLQRFWYKMKNVKKGLKQLHIKEFSGIKDKIKEWEGTLNCIQNELQSSHMDVDLQQREQEAITQVRRWRKVEDMALLQKARINWIRKGDENTAFFHAAIKERRASNTIYDLQDADGKRHNKADEIQAEIIHYFQKLQGTATNYLQMIDRNIMRSDPQVDNNNAQNLIREISEEDIKRALFEMDDNKAPGVDGFNVVFFKNTWDIIKHDLIDAVKEFFNNNTIFPPYNCTAVSLIPKANNANTVGDYRLITCCTVIYKIIYKIISGVLAGRLQLVIGKVIDPAQSGFIPGRQMTENILLATELIKGYSRKHNSPRCMIKMDLRKAYDSISWVFLFSVMEEMGFPLGSWIGYAHVSGQSRILFW